jgi:hypothetical protein
MGALQQGAKQPAWGYSGFDSALYRNLKAKGHFSQ